MQRIYVGQWCFFPELMEARSIHNWAPVYFNRRGDKWVAVGVNIPAQWMLDELVEWFGKWITGR
jgi:hypothetical protein